MEKKIKIGKQSEVQIVWKVPTVDYSKEEEENIRTVFANKYGLPLSKVKIIPQTYILNENGVISLNKDTIQSVHDPKFQQELFLLYLKEKGLSEGDYNFEEILKIDSRINALIDYSAYEQGRKYTLKWLDWDNFLSYGPNNHVDFTSFKGLVRLNSIPANQGGKSTFAYDLLHFLFYGKTSSGKMKVLGDLFNDNLPEATDLKVEGCVNIDGEDYIIKRTLTRPKLTAKSKVRAVTQKVEYYRLLPDGTQEELEDIDNLREENNVKTSQAIKEAIGNERDFDMVISANADNLKDLISLKETDRGRLLSRWVGLLPIEDKDVKAREIWNKEINANRYCTRYNRETLKAEIEQYLAQNENNEKEIKKEENKIKTSKANIEKLSIERDALLSSKKSIDNNLSSVDVFTLEKTIETITNEGINLKAQRDNEQQKLDSIGELPPYDENDYRQKLQRNEYLVTQIATVKANINNLKNTNITLEKSEYCPTCGKKFDNVDNSAKIAENTKTIEALIQQGVEFDNERKENLEKINAIEGLRAKHNEKNRLELLVSKYSVEMSNLRNDLILKKQLRKNIEDNKAAIEENNKIDTALNIVSQNIKVEESISDTAKQVIQSFKFDITNNLKSIEDRKTIIAKIEEELEIEKNWKIYLMLIGKDGISKMVLRNTLPLINSELSRFLDGVCDFDVEVRMDDKNDVDFKLINKRSGVVRRLAAGSGFEQTAASLALRVVLGNMSALSKPPFILLDEVLGGVAEENYENLKKLYDKISTNYNYVLQICHVPLEWYDRTITIIKNDKDISSVELN